MKILLILPDARIHKIEKGFLHISFREAPLTLTTLAALIPEELDTVVTIVDESVDRIPFNEPFDLVGISCLTGTATRAYKIADTFRKKKTAVVLGGVHVTLCPEEARRHADSIVIGFAEECWPRLLKDFAAGKMNQVYRSETDDLGRLPEPRRDLQKKLGYMVPNTVFATRGCRGTCDFCSVPAANFGWNVRPVQDVIREIKNLKSTRFVFNDVSLIEDREYAKKLFEALIPLKKKWGGLATVRIGEDEELLDLLRRSGCVYLLIGFESVESESLHTIGKRFNSPLHYYNLVRKLHDCGIIIQGCFIFGFDCDSKLVFDKTVQAVYDLKIDIPRYAIYTPYPNTIAFNKLKAENRILHENWQFYDTQHVVFQPKQMSVAELDRGFLQAHKQTFKLNSIVKRTIGAGCCFPITLIGNIAYRTYIKRLQYEAHRIHMPPTGDDIGAYDSARPDLLKGVQCE